MIKDDKLYNEVTLLIGEYRRNTNIGQCGVKDVVKLLIPRMRELNESIKDNEFNKRKLYLSSLIVQMNILGSFTLVDGLDYLKQKSEIFSKYRRSDFRSPYSVYVTFDQIFDSIEKDINLPLIEKTKQSVRKFYDLIAELWFGTFEMDFTDLLLNLGYACSYNDMCPTTYPHISKYKEFVEFWRS